jgi:hypothetical protein
MPPNVEGNAISGVETTESSVEGTIDGDSLRRLVVLCDPLGRLAL